MAIYLIRHGETASNAARIVQTVEVPLSEHGQAQAARLARRLAASRIAAVLTSDLRRATMTAEAIAIATHVPLQLRADLQERNYGDVRGRSYAELGVDILALDYEPPGGERWRDFHARVDRMWAEVEELARHTAGNLAVVTHGLVCYSLVSRHLQLAAGVAAPLQFANASVTVIDGGPPWVVTELNDTAHLNEKRDETRPTTRV
jgi:2,3-bisphosphoglycerate-dependent phosphoglycerate mutase